MSDSQKIRIIEVTSEGTNWIQLACKRILKRSLVNMVIKLSITERGGGVILEKLHDYQGFTKNSDHWSWLVSIIL